MLPLITTEIINCKGKSQLRYYNLKNKLFLVRILTQILTIWIVIVPTAKASIPSTLRQLIQEAAERNPQIRAARQRFHAATDVIPQSRSLADPKVRLGYMKMTGGNAMDVDPRREQMIGFSQEIPFPAKLYVRARVATFEAKKAEEEYYATYLFVTAQLKRSYYELYLVNKSIGILKKNQLLLEEIEKSARANYSVGKIPQQDIFRSQTEISRLLMRLVMLRQEGKSLEADINRLLNRPLDIRITTPARLSITNLKYNLRQLYHLLNHQSPKLQAQRENVKKSNQTINLTKLDYFPDFEIEAGRLRDTGMHMQGYEVMLKATVPLYFMSKQNYAVRENVARYSADVEDLYSTHRDLSFQVKNAYLLAQRSTQLIKLIQHTIIPQATLTFTSSQTNYGVGKVDFLTILNNLLTLQDNELELHSEIVQHEKAITQLEEIIGMRL